MTPDLLIHIVLVQSDTAQLNQAVKQVKQVTESPFYAYYLNFLVLLRIVVLVFSSVSIYVLPWLSECESTGRDT